jgi:TonB family protein
MRNMIKQLIAAVVIACPSLLRGQVPQRVRPADTAALTKPVVSPGDGNFTYFDFQVERQVYPRPGNTAPLYPPMLRDAKVEGEVLVQFVVDTSGNPVMNTFRILKSYHALFTSAVLQALPQMHFSPAELGGRKVRQLVQMPFQFNMTRDSTPPSR